MHSPIALGAGGRDTIHFVCITIAGVCKGCGWPTFRRGSDDRKCPIALKNLASRFREKYLVVSEVDHAPMVQTSRFY
jgi:hypothetical protein